MKISFLVVIFSVIAAFAVPAVADAAACVSCGLGAPPDISYIVEGVSGNYIIDYNINFDPTAGGFSPHVCVGTPSQCCATTDFLACQAKILADAVPVADKCFGSESQWLRHCYPSFSGLTTFGNFKGVFDEPLGYAKRISAFSGSVVVKDIYDIVIVAYGYHTGSQCTAPGRGCAFSPMAAVPVIAPLIVSCSGDSYSYDGSNYFDDSHRIFTGQPAKFDVVVAGGTGSYDYSWSGEFSGRSKSYSKSFSTPGTKTATALVTSGSKTTTAVCAVDIFAAVPSPSPYPSPYPSPFCIPNYLKKCYGDSLYWYDSCGIRQGLIQYCPRGCYGNSCRDADYGNAALIVDKAVRNLTSGSGFSYSAYANPTDTVMFMITLQATGNQSVYNVFVRDSLPANLTYGGQLVVACTEGSGSQYDGLGYGDYNTCGGYSYNYSGNIVSGINLNTIYPGQIVTITYHAKVAPASYFSYGITTLTNNVYVTSSNSVNPSGNASVIVSRSAVSVASYVSTGLTNNFLMDSFILPLLAVIFGIWLWKAGAFLRVEQWISAKRKATASYRSERELARRLKKLRNLPTL